MNTNLNSVGITEGVPESRAGKPGSTEPSSVLPLKLTHEEKDVLKFQVAKAVASWILGNQRISENPFHTIETQLSSGGHRNELIHFRFVKDQVLQVNTKIDAHQTRLRNLNYTIRWGGSQLFKGLDISYRKIEQLIETSNTKDYYEIFKKYRGV